MKNLVLLSMPLLLIFGSLGSLGARGTGEGAPEKAVPVRLLVPAGATLATTARLDEKTLPAGYEVVLEIAGSSDYLASRIISGEADFAVIPSNLAATLYNKGTGLKMAGPAIWGLLYVVTSENLSGWEDLRGRTVSMIGRGLTPDITFRHLLRENGLDPDRDLEIAYVSSAAELAPAFLTGRSTVSMMPEPMISTVMAKKPDTRILVDIQAEWRRLYGSSYPQASLVVLGGFQDRYPEFTGAFIQAFSQAVSAAVENPAAAGEAVAAMSPDTEAGIIASSIPRMNLEFVPAAAARGALEDYFRVLEAFSPAAVGGRLPDDDFYLP